MNEELSPFVDEIKPESEGSPAPQQGGTSGRKRTGPLWGGLILVVLGAVMLLQNLGYDLPVLRNWWALFILFPIVSAVRRAQWAYQRSGARITGAVAGPLVGAAALTLVMLSLLFGLSWSLMLPIALILFGLGALVSALGAGRR